MTSIIKHILLSNYEFSIEASEKDVSEENKDSKYNATFGYGLSYPEKIDSTLPIYMKLNVEFFKGKQKLYSANGVYQINMENATHDEINSKEFHIHLLKETYDKFSTLHNISVTQTPLKNAIISDEVLNNVIEQIHQDRD